LRDSQRVRLTLRWLVGTICLVIAGCGGDPPPEEADPEAVSKDLVEAVAEGSPEACELMTSRARRQAEITGGEGSCEEAIEAQARFVDTISYGTPPAELTRELDSGELEETREGMAFRFCVPNESEIELELVQVNGEWRVDLVAASRLEVVREGVDISKPCRIR
jgi:hypothetical protein